MPKYIRLVFSLLVGISLSIAPLKLSGVEIQAKAQGDINPGYISNIAPDDQSIITAATNTIKADFSYQPGANYLSSIILLNGSDITGLASPSATGFSYTVDLSSNFYTVEVNLVDDLGLLARRTWHFTVDTVPPTTYADQLPEFTTDNDIMVPVKGSDNLTGIQRTELWYLYNNDPNWKQGPIVTGLPNQIHFDADQREKEGRYVFATVASDNAGLPESKVLHQEAFVTYDKTPPRQVLHAGLNIERRAPGFEDSITCNPGSVADDAVSVIFYANESLTQEMTKSPIWGVEGQKACLTQGIGDNIHQKVYLVSVDGAGNRSQATIVENDFIISSEPTNLGFHQIDNKTVTVFWDLVNGAGSYLVRYRAADQTSFSDYAEIQPYLNNYTFYGLETGKQYIFSVSAKDLLGNEGPVSIISTRPTAIGGESGTTPSSTSTDSSSAPITESSQVSTESTSQTPIATGDELEATGQTEQPESSESTPATPPIETATTTEEENGEVKSENTEQTNRNWTPWIVLAILILLAGAATGGYFYWFGGPEEITTTVKQTESTEKEKKDDNEARW